MYLSGRVTGFRVQGLGFRRLSGSAAREELVPKLGESAQKARRYLSRLL